MLEIPFWHPPPPPWDQKSKQANGGYIFSTSPPPPPLKFELLRYSKNQHIKESTSYYSPNETTIEQTQCVKDLGIQMSVTLSFTDHINTTMFQSYGQKCGWIMRTFHTRDIHTMKTMVQHCSATYRLLLTTMDPPQNWRYPKNVIPLQIFFPPN